MKKLILALITVSNIFTFAQNPNFDWAKSFGSANQDVAHSVAVDGSGNVYTTGFFQSVVDFDPGPGTFTLASNGSFDVFVTKFDINGNFVWAKSFGGNGMDAGYGIALEGNSAVVITGYFNSAVDFDPGAGVTTYTSAGLGDIF